MNANKVIHEARGGCWHDAGKPTKEFHNYGCVKCGSGFITCRDSHPDYTDPVHYCALMDWISINYRSRKLQVYCHSNKDIEPVDIQEWLVLSREEQVACIAEAIEAGVVT